MSMSIDVSAHAQVRLIVVDSIAFPFRQDLGPLAHRTRLLQGVAHRLLATAAQHNMAVPLPAL